MTEKYDFFHVLRPNMGPRSQIAQQPDTQLMVYYTCIHHARSVLYIGQLVLFKFCVYIDVHDENGYNKNIYF